MPALRSSRRKTRRSVSGGARGRVSAQSSSSSSQNNISSSNSSDDPPGRAQQQQEGESARGTAEEAVDSRTNASSLLAQSVPPRKPSSNTSSRSNNKKKTSVTLKPTGKTSKNASIAKKSSPSSTTSTSSRRTTLTTARSDAGSRSKSLRSHLSTPSTTTSNNRRRQGASGTTIATSSTNSSNSRNKTGDGVRKKKNHRRISTVAFIKASEGEEEDDDEEKEDEEEENEDDQLALRIGSGDGTVDENKQNINKDDRKETLVKTTATKSATKKSVFTQSMPRMKKIRLSETAVVNEDDEDVGNDNENSKHEQDEGEMMEDEDHDEEEQHHYEAEVNVSTAGFDRTVDGGDDEGVIAPVKEILETSLVQHNRRNPRTMRRGTGGNEPKYLDETTLMMMKETLLSYRDVQDTLMEDDVVAFYLQACRAAEQKLESQNRLLAGQDATDEYLFDEYLSEEEDYALGCDLIRTLVTKINKTNHSAGYTVDSRTVNWIKRAAGIHRTKYYDTTLAASSTTAIGSLGSARGRRQPTTRRYTRGMAQKTNPNKNGQGMHTLCEALADIEAELGPLIAVGDDQQSMSDATANHTDDTIKATAMDGRVSKRTNMAINSLKKERIPPSKKQKKQQSRTEVESTEDNGVVTTPTVRLLGAPHHYEFKVPLMEETEKAFRVRASQKLPPDYVNAGIVHKLPSWDSLDKGQLPRESLSVFGPPRRMHSNRQYATFCKQLMNALSGGARFYATCEFFYSDIDRAWYNHDEFTEQALSLGVPKGCILTRREWGAIRRRMTRKPRIFSKRFISQQLKERNLFRSAIRFAQRNYPSSSTTSFRFPYDVPAPIAVGTIVSAYSHKYRIIQRGVVVSSNLNKGLYLVQFDNPWFGYEVCPDTEIASHGGPHILIPACKTNTTNFVRSFNPGSLPYGSRVVPWRDTPKPRPVRATDHREIDRLVCFEVLRDSKVPIELSLPSEVKPVKKKSLMQQVAETEILLTVMNCTEAGLDRLKLLLDAIEEANRKLAASSQSGREGLYAMNLKSSASAAAKRHYQWISDNLEVSSSFLQRSLFYLRTLYGMLYQTSSNETGPKRLLILSKYLDCVNHSEVHENSGRLELGQLPQQWSDIVDNETKKISEKFCQQAASKPKQKPKKEGLQVAERSRFLQSRLVDVAHLLFTAELPEPVSGGPLDVDSIPRIGALARSAAKLLIPSTTCTSHIGTGNSVYDEAVSAHESAVSDLQEAVDLLTAELALKSTRATLKT